MANYFELTGVSKYHIIAILVPIFCMCTTYIQKYELNNYNEILRTINKEECENIDINQRNTPKCKIREFPFYFNIFISKILSVILLLIKKKLTEKNSSFNLTETKAKRRYHLEVKNKMRKLKTALLILFISAFEVAFKLENYVTYWEPNYIELKLGVLILVPILSIIIFKKQIYSHHIFSLILSTTGVILICLSLLFIHENKDYFETKKQSFGEQMRHLFFSIYFSLSLILTKLLFERSFISPYSFLLYDGILCIFFPFILISFKSIYLGKEYFIDNLRGLLLFFHDFKIIIRFFCLILFSFCYYLMNTLTLFFFTPTLLISTDILSPFFRWVIDLIVMPIFNKDLYKIITENENLLLVVVFKLIGFIIIIIAALVYNEILILHFFKFDKNIEINIKKRGDKELISNNDELNSTIISMNESCSEVNMTYDSEMPNL